MSEQDMALRADRLTAEDQLRLHVFDPDTFEFSYEDADALVIEIDAMRDSQSSVRDSVIDECAKVVASFIKYGGSQKHGITINPYVDVSAILRAVRKLKAEGRTPAEGS